MFHKLHMHIVEKFIVLIALTVKLITINTQISKFSYENNY